MRKFCFACVATLSLCVFGLTGCGGGGETQVIEAPADTGEQTAMPGMSDEDYAKEMQKSMQQQGN